MDSATVFKRVDLPVIAFLENSEFDIFPRSVSIPCLDAHMKAFLIQWQI